MLTPSTPVATPFPFDSTNTAKAATVEANARAALQAQAEAASANEARSTAIAAAQAMAQRAATELPDPMASLSTVAVAGALNSLPAALDMLQRIALASASGTLTDIDRQALQSAHAQLTAKVASSVGGVGAGEQAQTSTAHDDRREGNADTPAREGNHAHRTTLAQTLEVPTETVQYRPVERTAITQKQTLAADGDGPTRDVRADIRTHELHVGTDSYEPAPMRQSFSNPTMPDTFGRLQTHAEAQHVLVTQAAQVTQFVQVAQTGHGPPLVAVA